MHGVRRTLVLDLLRKPVGDSDNREYALDLWRGPAEDELAPLSLRLVLGFDEHAYPSAVDKAQPAEIEDDAHMGFSLQLAEAPLELWRRVHVELAIQGD